MHKRLPTYQLSKTSILTYAHTFCYIVAYLPRDWLPKFATGLNMIIGCSSKSIWLTRLLFCQNGSPMRGSFWQKNSFITHILFELQPIIIFSPVANFGNQSIHGINHFEGLMVDMQTTVFIVANRSLSLDAVTVFSYTLYFMYNSSVPVASTAYKV